TLATRADSRRVPSSVGTATSSRATNDLGSGIEHHGRTATTKPGWPPADHRSEPWSRCRGWADSASVGTDRTHHAALHSVGGVKALLDADLVRVQAEPHVVCLAEPRHVGH